MIYDLIIIGAGAAGLFAAANVPDGFRTLVIEKTDSPGKKLLLTGSGQCNLTNDEPIKEFLNRYGENGKQLRPILFPFSNQALMEYFESYGLALTVRDDGKVFPASMKSKDVLNLLLELVKSKGVELRYNTYVTEISRTTHHVEISCNNKTTPFDNSDGYRYCIHTCVNPKKLHDSDDSKNFENTKDSKSEGQFFAKSLLVATGGESYPKTGSDGSIFERLEHLGLKLVPRRPALTSIYVENYPYEELSGLTFPTVTAKVGLHKCEGSLLFTHKGFSGPPILTLSRYVEAEDKLTINYLPGRTADELRMDLIKLSSGEQKQILTVLESLTKLPRSFLENVCSRCDINKSEKASRLSGKQMGNLADRLTNDSHIISGTGGFASAMTTAGGVDLDEINLQTMEAKRYPGLHFAGEVLDVDGDTGGYNLQFAFSSAMRCICSIL